MPVVTVEVPSLGNRCHLVHDGRRALVVDPPRDAAPVERVAEEIGVDIAAVADTHVHNDYVSGGLALARRHGADYLLAADEAVEFERVGVRDGDILSYGDVALRVLATPGHTRHHQSFVVRVPEEPAALFSGGSLLLGTVGRTDLVDPYLTLHLAGTQSGPTAHPNNAPVDTGPIACSARIVDSPSPHSRTVIGGSMSIVRVRMAPALRLSGRSGQPSRVPTARKRLRRDLLPLGHQITRQACSRSSLTTTGRSGTWTGTCRPCTHRSR